MTITDKNTIIISINPKWCELIRSGLKVDEIRRTKPRIASYPVRVLIYETGGVGIIGEFELRKFTYVQAWIDLDGEKHLGNTFFLQSCLTEQELFDYLYRDREIRPGKQYSGGWAWHIENLKIYDHPKPLSKFGLKRPPQSWCYGKIVFKE